MFGCLFKMDTLTPASTTAEHIITSNVFDPICEVHDKSYGNRDPRDNALGRGGHRADVNRFF